MSEREELINLIWGHGVVSEMVAEELADAVLGWHGIGEPVAYMVEWDDGAVDLVEAPMPNTGEEPASVTALYTC